MERITMKLSFALLFTCLLSTPFVSFAESDFNLNGEWEIAGGFCEDHNNRYTQSFKELTESSGYMLTYWRDYADENKHCKGEYTISSYYVNSYKIGKKIGSTIWEFDKSTTKIDGTITTDYLAVKIYEYGDKKAYKLNAKGSKCGDSAENRCIEFIDAMTPMVQTQNSDDD